jgi:Prokaryotic N-terminal methylation motif
MLHFFAKRLRELHEKKRDERGFTLIELLVVMKRSTIPLRLALYDRSVCRRHRSSAEGVFFEVRGERIIDSARRAVAP